MNKSDYVKLFQKEVKIPESTEKRLQAVDAEIIVKKSLQSRRFKKRLIKEKLSAKKQSKMEIV